MRYQTEGMQCEIFGVQRESDGMQRDASIGGRPFHSSMIPLVLAALTVVVAMLAACGCTAEKPVAARTGDIVIYEEDVNTYTAEYRDAIDANDDEAWARYLRGQGLQAKTWREQAVRELVGRQLVEKRAAELGITADENQVSAAIALQKEERGVAQDDESAWAQSLAQDGTTPEKYRANLEYASVLEQVLMKDGAASLSDGQQLQSYIESSLMDRVVKRLSVASFTADERELAEKTLDELKGLSGDELASRFEQLVIQRQQDQPDLAQGDLGWSLLYDINTILDPDKALALRAGDLYPDLVEREGGYQIYLCTGRFVFESGVQYSSLDDASLKDAIARAYLVGSWSSWHQTYLAQLINDASIEVTAMPSGLPYDVDKVMASLK